MHHENLVSAAATVFRPSDMSVPDYLIAGLNPDGSLSVPGDVKDIVLYGPYIRITPGLYEFQVKMEGEGDDFFGEFDLFDHGKIFVVITLQRGLKFKSWLPDVDGLEFRIRSAGRPFKIVQISIQPIQLAEADIPTYNNRALSQSTDSDPTLLFSKIWTALHTKAPLSVINTIGKQLSEMNANAEMWARASKACRVVPVFNDASFEHSLPTLLEAQLSPDAVKLCIADDLQTEVKAAHALDQPNLASYLMQFERVVKDSFVDEFLDGMARYDGAHQLTALTSGAIFCPCPFSAAHLRSTHSFSIAIDDWKQCYIFYRFDGLEPFYLLVAGWGGRKTLLYIPRLELALQICDPRYDWGPPDAPIVGLKRQLVSSPSDVYSYLQCDTRPALLMGALNNLGHFFWNELSGVIKYQQNGLLENIDCAILYRYCFVNPTIVINNTNQMQTFKVSSPTELFLTSLKQRLFCIRPTAMRIDQELSSLLRQHSLKVMSPDLRGRLRRARASDILIWFNLRSHNKRWLEQTAGAVAIAERAIREKRRLTLYLDGMPDCQPLAEDIALSLPSGVELVDGLNGSVEESIAWAFACDAYVSTIGAGLTLVTWIAAKPGVAHSERAHLRELSFWPEVRPGIPAPLAPPLEAIFDKGQGGYCDYSIDPQLISDLLFKCLPSGHEEQPPQETLPGMQ
jgi:hypothetical protein